MYHGMTIGTKHTYKDFGLIPTSRPVINPPSPNFTYVEVPGASGSLDISEAISGGITYADRKGSFEFYVINGRNWSEVYESIMTYLHGQRLHLILDDDNGHFYVGRISVNQWKSDKNNSYIVLDYQLEPYKYEITSVTIPWAVNHTADGMGWRKNTYSIISSAGTYLVPEGDIPITPIFYVESMAGNLTVKINNVTYALILGKNRLPQLHLTGARVYSLYTGTATVSVYTRRGWL